MIEIDKVPFFYCPASFCYVCRVVGGLLSAYDLSDDKVFLDKAKDIADRLLPAWDTPSGIPFNIINLAHGRPHNPGWTGVSSLLSLIEYSLLFEIPGGDLDI